MPDLQIEFKEDILEAISLPIKIDDIPYPAVLYFPSTDDFFVNKQAYSVLGIKSSNSSDVRKWWKMNPKLSQIIKLIKTGTISNQKYHVVLYNGKQDIVNFSSSLVSSSLMGDAYLIQISKASDKCSMCAIATTLSLKEEIVKLKPYLNKTGRTIFDKIMSEYFTEKDNKHLTLDDLVYYEKELRIIQKTYPFLSNREVILCTLLVNNMSSSNIANITNRTEGAVFVTIHRINKKLNLNNKNELIQILRDLVKSENDKYYTEESGDY